MAGNISVRLEAYYFHEDDAPGTKRSRLALEYDKMDYDDLMKIEKELTQFMQNLNKLGDEKAKEKKEKKQK